MMRIILPTDFSENAFNAIEYAAILFKDITCIFYLLHAYTPPIYRVDYALGSPGQLGLPDDHKYNAENTLEIIRKRIKAKYDNPIHEYVTHAAFNTLEDEVKTMVNKENIDLVIMGTQGATGAREILFGSNTVHVLNKAVVPILAIPSDYGFNPPKRILFPTDYEVNYSKTDLDFLLKLSKSWGSKLHVMHVSPPDGLTSLQKKNKTSLEKLVQENDHQIYDLPDQELIEAINLFQEELPVDMLVMVKNKHSFLERLFVEPVIRNIGLHSKIPFLVLPYNL
ncbi:universal stress protein [Muricauda sp. CAU 1633]|uniref:universal stress protein n=1 Tax=Allomuricauda sp. CAU 1633 TaxID=2816036 RepID=UPI001A908BCF|nr:universal stress protein [Muricauda sp. CAU 1633]MBO0323693.1 universal stress protein [Muricauda sp. CAU 1633]